MGKFIRFLVLVVVLFVVLGIAKNFVAKAGIENGVQLITGLKLKMQSLDFSLLRTDLGIKSLEIDNPKGFDDRVMLDMPEIYVNYKLSDILKGNIHMEEIRIDLNEFVVVKNKDGVLNLDSLKALQAKEKGAETPAQKKKTEKTQMPPLQIDTLKLSIGKVVYKDYSGGGSPSVQEFTIGIHEEYKNITDPNHLIKLIVLKAMMNTPLASLANINLGELTGDLTETLASSKVLASEAAAKATAVATQATETLLSQSGNAKALMSGAGQNLGSATESVEGTAKELAGALKNTAGGLKDKIKNPFSS